MCVLPRASNKAEFFLAVKWAVLGAAYCACNVNNIKKGLSLREETLFYVTRITLIYVVAEDKETNK